MHGENPLKYRLVVERRLTETSERTKEVVGDLETKLGGVQSRIESRRREAKVKQPKSCHRQIEQGHARADVVDGIEDR